VSAFKDLLYRELGESDKKASEAGFATNEPDYTESSEFMDDLLHYIYGKATTPEKQEEANRKIKMLNSMIERQLGFSSKFPLLEISTSHSTKQPRQPKQPRQSEGASKNKDDKNKDDKCIIL